MENDKPTTPRVRKPASVADATAPATTRTRTSTAAPAPTAAVTAPRAPRAPRHAQTTVTPEPEVVATVPRRPFLVGEMPVRTAVGIAAVAGILGGGIGAAVTSYSGSSFRTVVQPQAVTITNPGQTAAVTAVAAKALQSVVTIEVSSQSASGSGSGVIDSADGYIITNNHVATLGGAPSGETIRVTLSDGRLYPATVIGTDPVLDIAVLKIDATGLTPIEWADHTTLQVGNEVVAIGAPLGLQNTVTDGVVSAVNRSITISNDQNGYNFDMPGMGQQSQSATQPLSLPVIQTDASINPGNSGGALLNASGQLVGINCAIASSGSSAGSIGVGFALPSNVVHRVVEELIKSGSAQHGRIGAMVNSVTATSGVTGAEIYSVDAGSPAEKSGLLKGDIITTFNGVPIRDEVDITAQVRSLAPNTTVPFTYVRDGVAHDATVTLGSLG